MIAHLAVFHGSDAPLEHVEVSIPALRPGEILVRIRCCTLCKSDLHTHAGRRTEPTPTVLGHEIVGEIAEFGPGAVRNDSLGAPVMQGTRISWAIVVGCGHCFFCLHDLPQKCDRLYKYGHQQMTSEAPLCGGLADYTILMPNTAFYTVPDSVSDHVAAPANCATATVVAVLRASGPLEGRRVLVLGAGMLGLTACGMAHAGGASTVIACDPEPAGLARAAQFGATHLCSPDSLDSCVAEVTQGRGADIVLELAGTLASVQSAIALARIGGNVTLAGSVMPQGTIGLDPERLVRKWLSVRGVHNYHPHDLATALTFLAGPGRAIPFESLIAADYFLDQIEQAFTTAHSLSGVRIGVRPNL